MRSRESSASPRYLGCKYPGVECAPIEKKSEPDRALAVYEIVTQSIHNHTGVQPNLGKTECQSSVSAPLANYTVNFGCHIFFPFCFWHHNSTHVSRPLAARMNKRGTETPARRPLQPNQPTAHTPSTPHPRHQQEPVRLSMGSQAPR